MPAHPANHADIIFDITEGNLRDSFDIVKRYMDGMTVGEWPRHAVRPACVPTGGKLLDQLSCPLRPLPKSLPPVPQGPAGTPADPAPTGRPGGRALLGPTSLWASHSHECQTGHGRSARPRLGTVPHSLRADVILFSGCNADFILGESGRLALWSCQELAGLADVCVSVSVRHGAPMCTASGGGGLLEPPGGSGPWVHGDGRRTAGEGTAGEGGCSCRRWQLRAESWVKAEAV